MNKKNTSFFVFAIFWIVSFAFYCRTAGGGFVTDEIGWLQNYNDSGWTGLSSAFHDKSLHYLYHLFGFGLWKLFHLNGYGWMLFFITTHAVVGTLSFSVFGKLFSKTELSTPYAVSFGGALAFVLSPYQTEPLAWYACVHYLVCAALLLLAINAYLDYNEKRKQKFLCLFYLFALASAFTLEISFSLPFLIVLLILFFPFENSRNEKFKQLALFVFPSLIFVAGYLLGTKILRGSFAGHYGSATHFNLDFHLLMSNLVKYCSKIFALTQFLNFEKRNALYVFFEKDKITYLLFGFLCVLTTFFVLRYKQISKSINVSILLFAMFFFALLPILNLYFSSVVNVEGDRFSYFASIFAGQLIAFSLIAFGRTIGWILLVVFIFFNAKFLDVNTSNWAFNQHINSSLTEKFHWYDASHVYILNQPDNLQGTYMYRSFAPDNSFAETLALKYGKDIENKTSEIFEYNMTGAKDSVTVEKVSDNELKVAFAQSGNWWWSKGIGAGNYSTDDYEVKIDEWGASYHVTFKNKIPGAVYLYQCADEWREVKGF